MNNTVFNTLRQIYCKCEYYNSSLAIAILKILNITADDKRISWINEEGYKEEASVLSSDFFPNKYDITPLSLDSFDVECIEDLLSSPKYAGDLRIISPLLECIGWILDTRGERKTIHFTPSYTYTPPGMFWDFDEEVDWKDIDPESELLTAQITNGGSSYDWKKGTGFVDGLDMEKIKKINWLEDQE